MRLTVVLPCYNEEGNIEHTVRDVLAWFAAANVDGDIVVVNDGSRDGSARVLEALASEFRNVACIAHAEKKGYGAAITDGCDHAQGEVIAFMDSDGQFHAEDLGKLLPHMQTHRFVTGRRVHRADDMHRKLNAFLYGMLIRFRLGITVPDLNCGMKMFTRELWPQIRPQHATGALFNAEVYYRLKQLAVPVKSVPVAHYPRTKGSPDGARPGVIFRMFRELSELKRSVKRR